MPYIIHHYNGSPIRNFVLKDTLTVGRRDNNAIQIDDPTLSAEHAVIERCADGGCQVRDLDSTNGVLYKGRKVKLKTLSDGDYIVVGTHDLQFVEMLPDTLMKTTKIKKSWIPGVFYSQ